MVIKCIVCGKEFDAVKSFGKFPITCGDECFKENLRRKRIEYYAKNKNTNKNTKKKTNHNDFVEINDKAHALGMSYGQYVGLYMNRGE